MDINSLRVFLKVAELGSVSAAAKQLHYVQSNVTAHIKKLEQELAVELFARQSRGMALTHAGHLLVGFAKHLLRIEQQARHAIQDTVDGGGMIRLGSMETTMAVRLPRVLKALHTQLPLADIHVSTGTTQVLLEQLLNYQLDCALVAGQVQHPELASRVVYQEELVLLTPKQAGQAALSALLVFRHGCVYRWLAEQWMREQGRIPYKILEYGALEGIVGCVDAGLGCTLLPRSVVESKNFAGDFSISSLPPHLAIVETRLVWRVDIPPTQAMQTLQRLFD